MTITTGFPLRVDDLLELDEIHHWNPRIQNSLANQPNIGASGDAGGAWWRSGQTVMGWCRFHFDGSGNTGGTVGGEFLIDPPLPPDPNLIAASGSTVFGYKLGSGRTRNQDSAAAGSLIITVQFAGFPRNAMMLWPGQSNTPVANAAPLDIEADDRISFWFTYPADPAVLA